MTVIPTEVEGPLVEIEHPSPTLKPMHPPLPARAKPNPLPSPPFSCHPELVEGTLVPQQPSHMP